jgi:SAM-dependent methyltransferase
MATNKTPFAQRLRRGLLRRFGPYVQGWRMISHYAQLKAASSPRFALRLKDRWLCLRDSTALTGFDRHYIFHTAWASRVLAASKPAEHVDISSALYFVANASAFVPMRFYDYRPAPLGLSNLSCERADLSALDFADDSIVSLSCMHVVEHVGLGRYGDPLDYDGDLKAASELARVVAPGGQLLFVVPIGGEARIQFNAHRIYTYAQVLTMFPGFELAEFALIPDDGNEQGLVRDAPPALADAQRYGCGCFWLKKR